MKLVNKAEEDASIKTSPVEPARYIDITRLYMNTHTVIGLAIIKNTINAGPTGTPDPTNQAPPAMPTFHSNPLKPPERMIHIEKGGAVEAR